MVLQQFTKLPRVSARGFESRSLRHCVRMAARASNCALVTGFLFSSNLWYSFWRAGASFLMGINHFIGSMVSVPA